MEANQQGIAAMHAVSVSHKYGSGGGEVAVRLARKLGWQLVDYAVIEHATRELVLLADQCDVLHVRVVAPPELRLAYVARNSGRPGTRLTRGTSLLLKPITALICVIVSYLHFPYHCLPSSFLYGCLIT